MCSAPQLREVDELLERAALHPQALSALLGWAEALENTLPFRTIQAVSLTVASQLRCDYELARHAQRARTGGMSEHEINALQAGNLARGVTLNDEESAAAALGRCVADSSGRGCEAAFLRLSRVSGESTAVGCLMVSVLCVARSTMAHVWQLSATP